MNPIEFPSLELPSWDAFATRVAALTMGSPTVPMFVFRGQANSTWRLEPKLARILREAEVKTTRAGEMVEQRLLSQFESRAHHYVTAGQLQTFFYANRMARWSIMQHYGAPTRLLDWTQSAYVAAYFACTSHLSAPGSIFVAAAGRILRANGIEPSASAKFHDEAMGKLDRSITKTGFYASTVLSEREIVQMANYSFSLDVLSGHDEGIAKALVPGSPTDGPTLVAAKWIVPSSLKLSFLSNLRQMNIGAHSLFPGLDGLGRSLEEVAYLEAASV
ncbi:FRG domain-containing protein [Gemmatimonas sp.]|uniref:FRG domain-containing protein n=1 Tax=Gemmatimonas sp. TaxID=1962908 RepID=UPI00286E82FF|nr:FRG domain-containing protein [Gemmatimonas sp.]